MDGVVVWTEEEKIAGEAGEQGRVGVCLEAEESVEEGRKKDRKRG